MRELKALVDYASPSRLRRLAFIRARSKRNTTNIGLLYQRIASGKIESDTQASLELFGNASDARYHKLKYTLREQLINTVLLIEGNSDKKADPYRDFIELRKQLYVGEVLWKKGYPLVAKDILNRVLKKATRLEMTEIIVVALPMLRSFNISYEPNPKKYNEYAKLMVKWTKIYLAEQDVKNIYDELMSCFLFKTKTPLEIAQQARESLASHYTRFDTVGTVEHDYFSHFILLIEKLNENKFEEAIKISWTAISVLRSRKFTPRAYIRLFLLQIIASTLRFDGFLEGRKAVIEYLKIVTEGDHPWFRIYQLYIYLCIQSREFSVAVSVMNKIFHHHKFRSLANINKERWYLLRAYLGWLIASENTGKIEGEELHKFRVGRFVNEVREFSKDKQGMNISVLIIQCLWLIHQRKYTAARNRIKSLERYGNRHLRSSTGLERTYYFLLIFIQLAKADFQKQSFIRRSSRYLNKLIQYDRPQDQQFFEVEVVPYEHLYNYLLNVLDDDLH